MSTLSFFRQHVNLVALQPLLLAHNSVVGPNQMMSSSSFIGESRLDLPCAPQSPAMRSTKKGYQCTDELMLPEDFQPSAYSVICGRGRKSTEAVGNRRLAVMASLFAQRYSEATKKDEKTHIVSEILETMRSASPNPHHAFVRHSNGRWFRVQNLHAREKIGTVLRDSLHSKYRSSTKSKLAKRRQIRDFKEQPTKNKVQPKLTEIFSLDNEVHGEDLENIFA